MARIIWTKRAFSHFQEITRYIELDNPIAATHFAKKVVAHVKRLELFPKLGKVSPISSTLFRELVIPPCRVFYRIEKKTIFIVAVMRMERDLRL